MPFTTIDDAAWALVQAIRRGEPAATGHWRFQSWTSTSVQHSDPWGTPTRRAPTSRERSEALRDLRRSVDIGTGRIEVELDLLPDRYRLRVAVPPRDRLTTRQIIDEGYLFPNHPLPGLPRPAAANPTDRPTDPDTLARVAGLVGEFRTHYRALRDEEPEFSPGATEAEIAAMEAALGLRLPEDLRPLYLVVNGAWQSSGLLGFWDLWSVAGLLEEYHEGRPGSYGWFDDPLDNNYVVFDADPPGHVRRVSGNDWWVTIAADGNGNYLAVDSILTSMAAMARCCSSTAMDTRRSSWIDRSCRGSSGRSLQCARPSRGPMTTTRRGRRTPMISTCRATRTRPRFISAAAASRMRSAIWKRCHRSSACESSPPMGSPRLGHRLISATCRRFRCCARWMWCGPLRSPVG